MLDERRLNRALLARQLLLERSALPLPRVLERVAGLQAQYAPSAYVGLWARASGFERPALTRALERRTVVQATLMRSTIHLVSRRDFWPLALATAPARRARWLRAYPRAPSPAAMEAAAHTLRERLAGGTLRAKEIEALIGKPAFAGVGSWIALVRVPPSGTWERRRADLYAAAEDWIGPPPADLDEDAALEHLVRRYLAGFGPAAPADVAGFTGVPPATLRPRLERMRLRRLPGAGGAELLDVARAPLPDPATPAPVRLLGTWEAMLLAHARRAGVLPERHRPRFFDSRNPQSLRPFLVDGVVAGCWRPEDGGIRLQEFERLDAAARRELREEADRLAAFHAA